MSIPGAFQLRSSLRFACAFVLAVSSAVAAISEDDQFTGEPPRDKPLEHAVPSLDASKIPGEAMNHERASLAPNTQSTGSLASLVTVGIPVVLALCGGLALSGFFSVEKRRRKQRRKIEPVI